MSYPNQSPKPLKPGMACTACRAHKTKCSGERPVCRNCANLERICEYRPAPPSASTLEGRLRLLESQLTEMEFLRNASPYDSSGSGSSSASASAISSPASFRTIPRLPILQQWNPATPMPDSLRRELFNVFLAHHQDYNLDICLSRWQQTIELPPNHPDSFHPALLNAIYFAACSLSGATTHADLFKRGAQEQMRVSLSMCDRVEHWLYASVILTSEMCRSGSPASLMSNCAEMISIAFACNLHKFDTSFHYKTFDWGLMSTPRSSLHAAERINLWWSVFVLERSISIALSVPGSIPLEASMTITTPFPVPWDELAQRGLGSRPGCNLYTFCTTASPSPSGVGVRDTVLAMHAKAIATYAIASQVAKSFVDNPSKPHWSNYQIAETCLQTMLSSLPLFADPSSGMGTTLTNSLRVNDYTRLLCAHVAVLSAEIAFSGIIATQDTNQYRRRVSAARSMAKLARTMPDLQSSPRSNILLGTFWYTGADILVREINRCQGARLVADVATLKGDLVVIVRCMEWLKSSNADILNYITSVKSKILVA